MQMSQSVSSVKGYKQAFFALISRQHSLWDWPLIFCHQELKSPFSWRRSRGQKYLGLSPPSYNLLKRLQFSHIQKEFFFSEQWQFTDKLFSLHLKFLCGTTSHSAVMLSTELYSSSNQCTGNIFLSNTHLILLPVGDCFVSLFIYI